MYKYTSTFIRSNICAVHDVYCHPGARQAAVQQALAASFGEIQPMSDRRFTGGNPIPQVISPSPSDQDISGPSGTTVSAIATHQHLQ